MFSSPTINRNCNKQNKALHMSIDTNKQLKRTSPLNNTCRSFVVHK